MRRLSCQSQASRLLALRLQVFCGQCEGMPLYTSCQDLTYDKTLAFMFTLYSLQFLV